MQTLANENWDRFLPKFKHKNVKKAKPSAEDVAKAKAKAKAYTPFPPANHQMPSKVDLALESGEYFLTAEQKEAKKTAEKTAAAAKKKAEKEKIKEAQYKPLAADTSDAKAKERAAKLTTASAGLAAGSGAAADSTLSGKKRKREEETTAGDEGVGVSKEDKKRIRELASKFGGSSDAASERKKDKGEKKVKRAKRDEEENDE